MIKTKKVARGRKANAVTLSTSKRSLKISSPAFGNSLIQKFQSELKLSQSYISLFFGLLIVLIAGILVFNYAKKNEATLGPAGQTVAENKVQDVKPENLPGKYTVKDGDTLFTIAQSYYQDGYKYNELTKVNKIADENIIAVGQVLEIPKLENVTNTQADLGTGGAVNSTIWGDKISGDTYTVVEDDWLSKIAGRAYGNIEDFEKIAKANNITNPDLIEPGTVLKIPR